MKNKVMKLVQDTIDINESCQTIHKITKKRPTIVFSKEYPFVLLSAIHGVLKYNSSLYIGSLAVRLPFCTIRIYRKPDKMYRKKIKFPNYKA